MECPWAGQVVADSFRRAEAGSAEAQFMPALHMAARIGEAVFTAVMGMALTATRVITLTIPGAIIPGAGDIPGATDTAGLGIQGGDGTEVSAGMAATTRILPKAIPPTFMPIPITQARSSRIASFSRMRLIA